MTPKKSEVDRRVTLTAPSDLRTRPRDPPPNPRTELMHPTPFARRQRRRSEASAGALSEVQFGASASIHEPQWGAPRAHGLIEFAGGRRAQRSRVIATVGEERNALLLLTVEADFGGGAGRYRGSALPVRRGRPARDRVVRGRELTAARQSMTGLAIAGGSRPARSQPAPADATGTPTTIRTRGSTGTRPR